VSDRYVALLRAVNVGGRVVKMDQLRAIFESLRFANVATLINSGNVIFDARQAQKALESLIERRLQKELGYPVITFVRTIDEIRDVADHQPFGAAAEGTQYVAFLKDKPAPSAARLLVACSNDIDRFHVHGREAYWLTRGGFSDSTFSGAKLEKLLGPATSRNINTVRKLAEK
jgi:uncharacterized protein (DUF1697 family)